MTKAKPNLPPLGALITDTNPLFYKEDVGYVTKVNPRDAIYENSKGELGIVNARTWKMKKKPDKAGKWKVELENWRMANRPKEISPTSARGKAANAPRHKGSLPNHTAFRFLKEPTGTNSMAEARKEMYADPRPKWTLGEAIEEHGYKTADLKYDIKRKLVEIVE